MTPDLRDLVEKDLETAIRMVGPDDSGAVILALMLGRIARQLERIAKALENAQILEKKPEPPSC